MKTVYACSLIKDGVLGGGLYLNEEGLRYRTGKAIQKSLRDFTLPWRDMSVMEAKGPVFTVTMKDGTVRKFLIFRKKAFTEAVSVLSENDSIFGGVD